MFLRRPHDTDKVNNPSTGFKSRAPYSGYRPVDYEGLSEFIDMKPVLDGYLEKLFAGDSSVDEGNKDTLDPLINDMAEKAEQDLNRQRIDHTDNIHRICDRRVGDKFMFEKQLEQLKVALEENEQELDEIESRYKVNKF